MPIRKITCLRTLEWKFPEPVNLKKFGHHTYVIYSYTQKFTLLTQGKNSPKSSSACKSCLDSKHSHIFFFFLLYLYWTRTLSRDPSRISKSVSIFVLFGWMLCTILKNNKQSPTRCPKISWIYKIIFSL